ncbi:hypothetical protein RHSIM_Rhsim03G0095000 [Rhododendron simsii]|uniref:CCHC-type domain-containing protein n=1 Tax=Rhododendron simsii TaxID=118357 RepID=A0A834HGE2_RHOSS|nr:hypothetical protein RHSIM_Rhsim03G0095000 [Rhododendron simsii]
MLTFLPAARFKKKSTTRLIYDPLLPISCKELYPRHQKSISQSSILEEQPEWLDNLLGDSDANTKGTLHRPSASDSMTLLDGLVSLNDDDSSVSSETGCLYGPNSPRSKGKFTFPENTMVSALSDCLFQNPMEYLDGGLCASVEWCIVKCKMEAPLLGRLMQSAWQIKGCHEMTAMNLVEACSLSCEADLEVLHRVSTALFRLPRKRKHLSMSTSDELLHQSDLILLRNLFKLCLCCFDKSEIFVSKALLIMISFSGILDNAQGFVNSNILLNWKRTVDVLQTLESELAVGVASLLQQRAALSMENGKLKQQMARLKKENVIVDESAAAAATLESELSVGVASLLQQRAALSMENGKLKQQMAGLKKEKVIVDESGKISGSNPPVTPTAVVAPVPAMVPVNHAKKPRFDGKCFVCDKQGHKVDDCRSKQGRYQSLKKELERLKIRVGYSSSGDFENDFRSSSAAKGVSLDAAWQMLDIGELNLNPRN